MALVSSSIPNLINGISQQPAEIRLASQAERQVNGLSSVARGLEKRPGTEHKAKLSSTAESDSFIHSIRRDREEEYTMILSRTSGASKTLEIYDQDGTSLPVKKAPTADVSSGTTNDVTPSDLSYLETTSVANNIVATTVADTTFLINKTVTVNKATAVGKVSGEGVDGGWTDALPFKSDSGATLDSGFTHEGFIYVKQGDYSSKYVVILSLDSENVSGEPAVLYKVGYQTPSSVVGLNQAHIATVKIAKTLLSAAECTGTTGDNGWNDADMTSTAAEEGFGGLTPRRNFDENGVAHDATGFEGGNYYDGLSTQTNGLSYATVTPTAIRDKFKFTRVDSTSVIRVQCKEAFTIKTMDSKAGNSLIGVTTETTSFSNLPAEGIPNNFIVKIVGNADATQDDFYVKYDSSSKVWKESIGPAQDLGFDTFTMPHRLIRLYDNTSDKNKYFLYEPVKELPASNGAPARFGWSSRKAGDDGTNPFPSFTGGKINDICFHKNRFGILSDENIIFSVAGNFYNFLPISAMTALDSNPIDISVSNNEVSLLRHAAAFNQSLLLFSDFQQFSLNNSGQSFAPATVSVDVVTQFESTAKAPPVSSGKFVYFPFKRGEYSGVREYFVDMGTAEANDARDITAHVPQYIKGNITKMVVSSTDQMIAVLSDDDLKRVYVYKNFWEGQEKIQHSWSHWTFDGDILNCAFLGSTLKLLVKRSDGIYLEDINLSLDSAEAVMEDETAVLLDRRVKLGSVVLTNSTTVDGNSTITVSSTSDLKVGMRVQGTGIPVSQIISSIPTSTTFVLGTNATESNSNTTLTFIDQLSTIPYSKDSNGLFNLNNLPSNMVYVTANARKVIQGNVDDYLATNTDNVVYAGIPYTFEYEFSRFIHKENELPVQTAKLQVRNINLLYNKTGFFNVKVNVTPGTMLIPDPNNAGQTVSSTPRTNYSKNFSGMITNTSSFGQYKLLSGTFKSSVMTNSSNCNIILENDQYLPCAFQSAEWEGFLHVRSRRM